MALSTMDRAAVLARDGMRCVKCGAEDGLQVDHIWPRVHGGGDEPENLQALCATCNTVKGARVDGLTPPAYVTWPPPKIPDPQIVCLDGDAAMRWIAEWTVAIDGYALAETMPTREDALRIADRIMRLGVSIHHIELLCRERPPAPAPIDE